MEDAPLFFENPFCTRRVKPGAVRFLFPHDVDAATLVTQLQQNNWWGQIIGPHGTGKSTLLETLIAAIEAAGHPTTRIALHDGQRRLPVNLRSDPRLRPATVLVIDGYEQLSHWSRMSLKRFCRRHRVGLLVTAHESVGLPELFRTNVTPELAERVVEELLGQGKNPFTREEMAQLVSRRHGDLRETLFDLYDIFEGRRPPSR